MKSSCELIQLNSRDGYDWAREGIFNPLYLSFALDIFKDKWILYLFSVLENVLSLNHTNKSIRVYECKCQNDKDEHAD